MPISDCEVRDPRIRRTRQLLQGALKQLMDQKPFDEISVQDITEAATVNRATFYDHYNDKFALLDALVAGGFHKLLHERNVIYDGTCPTAARAIILATCDYFVESRSNHSECERQGAFEPLMDAAIAAAIRRVLIQGMKKGGTTPEEVVNIAATAASWTVCGAVKEWFSQPGRSSADELVPLVLRLILPSLQPEHAQAETVLHG
jgi:AcrR family transcriptional regulator